MNRKILIAVISSVTMSALSCGKSSPPCSGSSCLSVAGTYLTTITQSPGTTCMYITYGTSSFQTELILTQQGSALTAQFPQFLGVTITGTLREDNSADFNQSTTANVDSTTTSQTWEYTDQSSLNLQFQGAGTGISVTGTKEDILTATVTSPNNDPDNSCILEGNLTASPAPS